MRIFFAAILTLGVSAANCQTWFDLGIKAEWGGNLMLNKNIMNDSKFSNKIQPGFGLGGKVGINFSNNHEFTMEVLWSRFNQKFAFSKVTDTVTGGGSQFEKSFFYTAIDLIPMYRLNTEGRYFEVGPQFSIMQKSGGSSTWPGSTDPSDISNYFNKFQAGAVLGFGSYMLGTDNFGITLGARFRYMFTDLISDAGQVRGYPSETSYSTYAPSRAFSAMLVMEMNYDLGYLASAKCAKRTKLILF
jgi:hypothetical protein